MPSHGRKKSKKTGVLGQALISDRFGRKGVFRASDANLPENAKQLLANQHFLDDEEKMSTKLRSVTHPLITSFPCACFHRPNSLSSTGCRGE